MRRTSSIILAAAFALIALPAAAQVEGVAEQGIPAGNIFAPRTPSGFFNLNNDIWFGDEAQGFRHYVPLDQSDTDPLTNQQFKFDTTPDFSIGGGTACVPYCSVGQVAQRSPLEAFVAVWDHAKGQPGQIGGGGVYHLTFADVRALNCPECSPIGELVPLAPTKGLAGNQPTSAAYGPDGKVYVGFLRSPSYVRISGVDLDNSLQTVEPVGSAPNAKSIFGMQFYGSDLYLVTSDGLYIVPNVVACNGNANSCGAPKLVWNCGGPCTAITADRKGNIYFAQNAGGRVWRYTPATAAPPVLVAAGFTFAAHTNGLGLDREGNLWIGDNPAPDGTPNGGRLSRILAANLAPAS